MIKVTETGSSYELEERIAPFGFKGRLVKEPSWQRIVLLKSENRLKGLGLSNQSVLWSDPEVFIKWGEVAGNQIMYLMTEFALEAIKGIPFKTPMDLMNELIPLTWEYGKKVSCLDDLKLTFALNSLVGIDYAAWMLYARHNAIERFDGIIPGEYRDAFNVRHESIGSIPLISYNVGVDKLEKLALDGYFFFKIKIGADPDGDNDPAKMLDADKKRIKEIHDKLNGYTTKHTDNGRIAYYLDANGRYDHKERLMRLLDYIDSLGALEYVKLLEEPFAEEYMVSVHDVPVRVAADESAHSVKDVNERIDLGYGAIALKPIAKTMSVSFEMAGTAYRRKTPCFCADLTVNPILVDLNKCFAARLKPIPGVNIGVMETNGNQNYKRWEQMQSFHPRAGASWTKISEGKFYLDRDFYDLNGGIFEESEHYLSLVK